MSEKMPKSPEAYNHSKESLAFQPEATIESSSEKSVDKHKEQIESLRHGIEKQALPKESLDQTAETNSQAPVHHYITKHIKLQAYKSTIKNTQKSLPNYQARFSRIIHQQNIETISEVGSKTIARPSGIFSGSLVALIGSITVIAIAKHIGFTITPTIFITLFALGFLLGIVIETLVITIKKVFGKTRKHTY